MSFFARDLTAAAAVEGPVIQWEEPACLLCGGWNSAQLLEAPDSIHGGTGLWFAVVQCQECGLCYTSPRPNDHSIGQFYPDVYKPHRAAGRRPARWRPYWFGSAEQGTEDYLLLPGRGQRRLLDFGCGAGSFLARMHRQSWNVTGIDVSSTAVERVRSELGLQALVGTLPHPELRPCSFELVTMWHSLEHVHEPLAVLREARRLLVPGGRLVVAAPNIDSLPFRWFGPAWYGLDLPRHLTHFSPWTLQHILLRAGFRPGRIRMVRHGGWLRSSAKLACQARHSPRWQRWLASRPASSLATWYAYLTRQSDCLLITAER
jgi:2-polyprenyl-3-methyl-5-hydroxy-6-metoxy-1,4-benzoquinol methylase